jgi:hypothetical protein
MPDYDTTLTAQARRLRVNAAQIAALLDVSLGTVAPDATPRPGHTERRSTPPCPMPPPHHLQGENRDG